jgi:ABC-2 type transport system ATP-binding protein
MNVIETSGLGKRYRRTWALRDCTLAIPGGNVVALVGPNGAGKTTLLSLVVGLNRQTTGTVTVLGGEPVRALPADRGRLAAGAVRHLDRRHHLADPAPLGVTAPGAP